MIAVIIPTGRSGVRGFGQRVAFAAAIAFYACALASIGALLLWVGDLGGDHPVIASLGASVVFFVGAGIVLHVIGRADLPSLRVGGDAAEPRDRP